MPRLATVEQSLRIVNCAFESRPISENTFNAALRRLRYGPDDLTAHRFRSPASTLLNESGKWHPDAIERAMAHGDSNAISDI